MIGAAGLPKAMAATPAPSSRAHAVAADRDAAMAAPSHGARPQGAAHPAHRRDTDAAHDGDAARDTPSADGHRHADAKASTARRAARTAHPPRGTQDDADAPQDDAFARLLTPGTTDKTTADKAPAVAAQGTAAPEKPGTLPDQLLGLLASLAPGANTAATSTASAAAGATTTAPAEGASTGALPVSANATPTAQAAAATPPAAPTIATPAGDKPAAGNGDAVAALPPALQGQDSIASAPSSTASHADVAIAPAPASHAATAADAPSAASFDALLHATTTAPVADAPRAVASAPTPLAQPADPRAGYGDDLAQNVVWMAGQRLGHVQMRVAPDHLGPIEVRLQLDGSQVQASFLSAQPDVRHALEASLPRLRELLGQHGLQLAQADVGQRQQDPRGLPMQRREADGRDPHDDGLAPTLPTQARVVRGLLDEYA